LLVSNTDVYSGDQPGPQDGPPEYSYDLNEPFPIEYDSKEGRKLQPQHKAMCLKLKASLLEEARRLGEQMRNSRSAVVELNVAKIALDQIDRYNMSGEQLQAWQRYVEDALQKANQFIIDDENRYVPSITTYLEHLQNRLNEVRNR
jgi:hypothetical protein